MSDSDLQLILGVDLDGVCADFYGTLRPLVAEWQGRPVTALTETVSYGLPEWGLDPVEYLRVHRWAVAQRRLFEVVAPIPGAASALRRLSSAGVRIRIITHRLYVSHFHQPAVLQTVQWLDTHGFPYSDLCFMADKGAVGADLYVEDAPGNIEALRNAGLDVIVFANSTNLDVDGPRAETWVEVEEMVLGKLNG